MAEASLGPTKALSLIICVLATGCAASVHRQGYEIPEGEVLVPCNMPIRSDRTGDLSGFEVIGQIEVGDSSFSTDCDEAIVLHQMTIDACHLEADLINITEEHRPDFWSTCYRAKADFLRVRDRPERVPLVSDDKYRADAVRERAQVTHRRNREMITGAIVGGVVGGAVAGDRSLRNLRARFWRGDVMTMKIVFAALAIAAGVAAALQAAINAALSKSTGLGPALIINTVVVLIGAIGLWAVMGAKTTFFPAGTSWMLYLGGVFGFVIIASLAFVFPKIGAAYAVALMIGGQCVAALLVDHFGLMGMPHEPLTILRVIGVALIAAGAAVVRA